MRCVRWAFVGLWPVVMVATSEAWTAVAVIFEYTAKATSRWSKAGQYFYKVMMAAVGGVLFPGPASE